METLNKDIKCLGKDLGDTIFLLKGKKETCATVKIAEGVVSNPEFHDSVAKLTTFMPFAPTESDEQANNQKLVLERYLDAAKIAAINEKLI